MTAFTAFPRVAGFRDLTGGQSVRKAHFAGLSPLFLNEQLESNMAVLKRRTRPAPWPRQRAQAKYGWLIPLFALEWGWRWLAYFLSGWAFLERVGISGSPGIFRNLVPLGCGRIVFWGEQGPDETETLSSLAGN